MTKQEMAELLERIRDRVKRADERSDGCCRCDALFSIADILDDEVRKLRKELRT